MSWPGYVLQQPYAEGLWPKEQRLKDLNPLTRGSNI